MTDKKFRVLNRIILIHTLVQLDEISISSSNCTCWLDTIHRESISSICCIHIEKYIIGFCYYYQPLSFS